MTPFYFLYGDEQKEIIEDLDEQFESLLRLVKEEKIIISWRANSFSVSFKNIGDDIEIIKNKEFNSFTMKFLKELRHKILEPTKKSKYDEYIDKYIQIDPYIKGDIITRSNSKVNICNSINSKILTKRDIKLYLSCYSALINLEIQKPGLENPMHEQVNFELSERDLKIFIDELKSIQNNIDKIKSKR